MDMPKLKDPALLGVGGASSSEAELAFARSY